MDGRPSTIRIMRRFWPLVAVAVAVVGVVVLLGLGIGRPGPPENISSEQGADVFLGIFGLLAVLALLASLWFRRRLRRSPVPDQTHAHVDDPEV